MGEGVDTDITGESEARRPPVSGGPFSLLAWPLGNLASILTGVPHLPEDTQFRWNMRTKKAHSRFPFMSFGLLRIIQSSGHLLPNPLVDHLIISGPVLDPSGASSLVD